MAAMLAVLVAAKTFRYVPLLNTIKLQVSVECQGCLSLKPEVSPSGRWSVEQWANHASGTVIVWSKIQPTLHLNL